MPRSTKQLLPPFRGMGRNRLAARRRRKVPRSQVSYLVWPARKRLARLGGAKKIFGLWYSTKRARLPGASRVVHIKIESNESVVGPTTMQQSMPDPGSTSSAGAAAACPSSPGPSAPRCSSPTPGPSKERSTSPDEAPCSGGESESSSGDSPPRPAKRIYCEPYHPNNVSQWVGLSTLRSGRTVKPYDPEWIKRMKKKNPDWTHNWPLPGWVTSGERARDWFKRRDAWRQRRIAHYNNCLRQEELRRQQRRQAWLDARRIQRRAERDARRTVEKLVYWACKAVDLAAEGKLLLIWPSGPSGKLDLDL